MRGRGRYFLKDDLRHELGAEGPVLGPVHFIIYMADLAQRRCRMQHVTTRMWANAQRDGRPAEYRWRSLFNAAKFG